MILQRPVERGGVAARYSQGTLLVQLGEGAGEEVVRATVEAHERRRGVKLALERTTSSHVLLSCACGWKGDGPTHWLKARVDCPRCEQELEQQDVGQEVRVYGLCV